MRKDEAKGHAGKLRDYLAQAQEPIGIYAHSQATDTCEEKIALLNRESGLKWELHQAVKALYFMDAERPDKWGRPGFLYCFVTPEFGKHIDKRQHAEKKLWLAHPIPEYMELGTCTPFLPDWDTTRSAGRVQRIYVHHDPKLDDTLVDVPIGGTGPEAHKRSVWIPYGALRELLVRQFDDVVMPCTLQYVESSKPFKRQSDGVKVDGR